jgi:hypothetical protein
MKCTFALLGLCAILTACTAGNAPPADAPAATRSAASGAASRPAADWLVWVDDLDLTQATQGLNTTNKNLSAAGNPVTLKGRTFAHAVGTHANGMIVIDVHGAAKSFSATVGVDDDAQNEGSVGFTVIGDGKVLVRTGTIWRMDPAKKITADLTGVRQLVLQVDSGDDDNINNDYADWAEPLITLDPAKADQRPQTVPAAQAKLP